MRAVYHTSINKLTSDFLKALKIQFKNAKVDIVIRDVDETEDLKSIYKNLLFIKNEIIEMVKNEK